MSSRKTYLIKKLRKITGCSIIKCVRAINSTGDNIKQALNKLRRLGDIEMKYGSNAKNKLIFVLKKHCYTIVIELNLETNFVVKNKEFLFLVKKVLYSIYYCKRCYINGFLYKCVYENNYILNIIAKYNFIIQEYIEINRVIKIKINNNEEPYIYIHNKIDKYGGKMISCVVTNNRGLYKICRHLATHNAATSAMEINVLNINNIVFSSILLEAIKNLAATQEFHRIFKIIIINKVKIFMRKAVLLEQYFIMNTKNIIRHILSNYVLDIKYFIKI